ncbi:MAG TPA: adenylate kinase, partial [Candidatus Nanoarchaeia archaeon]|nr:adenylate kinase [Candidatus Nanoarchaeia archaeon]
MSATSAKRIIFLGPPGAGKGTIASMLSHELGIPQVSTGDLFRSAVAKETALGKKAKGYMDRGELVPDQVTIDLLKECMQEPKCKQGFILDGFPRTVIQADALAVSGIDIDRVVSFTVPEQELLQRLVGRMTCRKCGAIYHVSNLPPKIPGKCDRDGGELYQREDQKPEAIKKRLQVYKEQTAPLITY